MSDHVMVLREGGIEQFDPPSRLFSYPRTEYVAQFIGTPATNVLDYEVERSGGDVSLVREGSTITLSESVFADTHSDTASVGVRPQHLSLDAGEYTLTLTVDVVEPLGTESVIHARADDGTPVDIVSDADNVMDLAAGEAVDVGFDREHLFVFDDNGETVLFGDRSEPPEATVNPE